MLSEEISELRNRLKELEVRVSKIEKLVEPKLAQPNLGQQGGIQKIAEATNLSSEQLENVFEFNENDIRFIAPLTGSVPEKQINFAQCVLIGLELIYQKKSIDATELSRQLDDYGLDTKNLARSLANRTDIFRKIGKKRQTKYKLTDVGKASAIQLVRTLSNLSQS
jgi:hypothetical protein